MDSALVAQVRRFNRTVTQRIGALEDAYLASGRPLGQARLLWEIGPAGTEVRDLRSRLDLDSGYLSRLLRALTAEGLVTVRTEAGDARVRTAHLTAAGRAERAELDRRSDDLAASILAPLNDGQRVRLVGALAQAEQLLVASMVDVEVVDPRRGDAQRCLQAYFAELAERFEDGFEPAHTLPAAADDLTAPAGLFLVATLHAEPVGCGGLRLHPDGYADVKRMWVAPGTRGLGLGRRLLAELETRAATHGVHTLRLETNRTLTEAIGLYRAAGFREVPPFNTEPYAHHWFEKHLPPAP